MAKLRVSNRYATVPNEILTNRNISFKAKGVWAYIQSKPDGWSFSAERISDESNDGRDSIKSALIELEKEGLLNRLKFKNEKGQWEHEYVLNEKPMSENPTTENPPTAKASYNKESNIKKDIQRNNIILHSEQSSQVNELMGIFYTINPGLNFGNKTQRKAMEWFVEKYGIEKARNTVQFAVSVQGQQYAPTITSPLQLKNKIGDLTTFFKKQNNNSELPKAVRI